MVAEHSPSTENGILNSFVFSIDGWARQDPSRLVVHSQAEIDFARKIIASEVKGLAARLKPLEAKLKAGTAAYDKVAASKVRPEFDIRAVQLEGALNEKPFYFAPNFFQNADAKVPEQVGMAALDWLSLRFPGLGPVVCVSGDDEFTLRQQAQECGFVVSTHAAGMGSTTVTMSGLGDRMRPSSNSLVAWFASANPKTRASASFFLLGDECDSLDVGLLQTRMAPHHVVCVAKQAPAVAAMLQRWDGHVYEMNDAIVFTDPGPMFLDPADGGGSHIPDAEWPKISVVTVSYNQADFLEECLLSVLDQNYPNLEYIVVDAVSDDGSIDILERYRSRIDTLLIEKDNGQSDGLNKGFDLATGEIYTWINSDDMLKPGALRRAALAFMEHGTDLVAGGCERTTEDADNVTLLHFSALPYLQPTPLGFAQNLIWQNSWEKGDYFFQPEVVFSARIWKSAGACLKDHLYWAMDWELWIRMAMAGADVVHIPDRIGVSREHPAQKTTGEELYLHQLLNILLETDDALVAVQATAADLPPGEAIEWQTHPEPDPIPARRSLVQRLLGLRKPHALRRAVIARLKPHQVQRLRTVRHRANQLFVPGQRRRNLQADQMQAAFKNLQSAEQDREEAVRVAQQLQGELATVKARMADIDGAQTALQALVTTAEEQKSTLVELEKTNRAKEKGIRQATAMVDALKAETSRQKKELEEAAVFTTTLKQENKNLRKSAKLVTKLQAEREQQEAGLKEATKHVAELEAETKRLRKEAGNYSALQAERAQQNTAPEEMTKHNGELQVEVNRLRQVSENSGQNSAGLETTSKQIASFASSLLFGSAPDAGTENTVRDGLDAGRPMISILRDIARAGEEQKSSQDFRDFRHHLRDVRPMPAFKEAKRGETEFVIVDVGAEPLSFENDVYAPLIDKQDCLLVRFDPFDDNAQSGNIKNADRNGSAYRDLTYATFVGDGKQALFHINRFQPTSSLLDSNEGLVEPFGLLKDSLETVETRNVETDRLDDIFDGVHWMPHGIDLLKIDVQGATQTVIENASATLSKTLIVQLEAEFSQVYKGEQTFATIDETMRGFGFGLLDLRDMGHMPYEAFAQSADAAFHAGRLLWSDAVYVRHLDGLDALDRSELMRLAVMAHQVYGKYDFAAECLRILDGKTGKNYAKRYVKAMQ